MNVGQFQIIKNVLLSKNWVLFSGSGRVPSRVSSVKYNNRIRTLNNSDSESARRCISVVGKAPRIETEH